MRKKSPVISGVADELPDLGRALPVALLRGREVVMAWFRPLLDAHDLTEQQWRVIRAVEQNPGIESSELARQCLIINSSLTRILQNLERRNLIRREKVRRDQRRSSIALTTAGYKLFTAITPDAKARYQELEQRIGKEDMARLLHLLQRLEQRARPVNRQN